MSDSVSDSLSDSVSDSASDILSDSLAGNVSDIVPDNVFDSLSDSVSDSVSDNLALAQWDGTDNGFPVNIKSKETGNQIDKELDTLGSGAVSAVVTEDLPTGLIKEYHANDVLTESSKIGVNTLGQVTDISETKQDISKQRDRTGEIQNVFIHYLIKSSSNNAPELHMSAKDMDRKPPTMYNKVKDSRNFSTFINSYIDSNNVSTENITEYILSGLEHAQGDGTSPYHTEMSADQLGSLMVTTINTSFPPTKSTKRSTELSNDQFIPTNTGRSFQESVGNSTVNSSVDFKSPLKAEAVIQISNEDIGKHQRRSVGGIDGLQPPRTKKYKAYYGRLSVTAIDSSSRRELDNLKKASFVHSNEDSDSLVRTSNLMFKNGSELTDSNENDTSYSAGDVKTVPTLTLMSLSLTQTGNSTTSRSDRPANILEENNSRNSINITPEKRAPSEGSIYFIPLEHEPRIYVAAPSGVYVTRMMAAHRYNSSYSPTYTMHSATNDSHFFQIHGEFGNITTRMYIAKKAGETYNLTIVARGNGTSASQELKIRVVEYNRYPPQFEKLNYTVELDILTPVHTEFLTVRAFDNDSQPYNSEIYYNLMTLHDVVFVNKTTGVLTLNKLLHPTINHISATIIAKDGGSPERWGKTKLTIIIKILSAPRQVTVMETGDRWVQICWEKPLSGYALGYSIWLHNNIRSVSRNLTVSQLGKKNNLLCMSVTDLQQKSDYSVQVAGWSKDEVGIITPPLPFNTRVNRSCQNINSTDYTCTCLPGFYGDGCSHFNPCNGTEPPCQNGGLCKSPKSDAFSCECLEGYYGLSCEYFNPCSRSPCQHNSTCFNISATYKCLCKPGYSGNQCEINIDECSSDPCINGATCVDGLNNYTCICDRGFEGPVCQTNIDECQENPCRNGGTCDDKFGSFTCHCPLGYEGEYCETDIDECQSNPCENNGICMDGVDQYFCNCTPGYEGDDCEYEIDECMARPCLNGGTCTDVFNGFICDCPPGYNGTRCEWDLDLCVPNPCKNGAACFDLVDHFECRCAKGYQGMLCDMKVHCPEDIQITDRGTFVWEPIAHGMVSSLSCPYGMDPNYTEHMEHLSLDSISGLSYRVVNNKTLPSLTPKMRTYNFDAVLPFRERVSETELKLRSPNHSSEGVPKRTYGNSQRHEDRFKRLSVASKLDPAKLHAHLKDIEYRKSQELTVSDQQREMMELKLRIDEEGRPYAVRSCIHHRDGSVKWGKMVDSICRDKHSRRAEKWSLELVDLTKDPAQINVTVFQNASSQIKQILNYALTDRKIAKSMFSVLSNMMAANESVLEDADRNGSISKSLIHVIDTYTNLVKLPHGKMTATFENLAFEVREVFSADGLAYSPIHASPAIFLGELPNSIEEDQDISINIPREALDRALRQLQNLRVQFVSYKNSKFFRPNNNNSSISTSMNTKQRVVSASLSNISIGNLSELLVYNFRNIYGNSRQICVYWDPENQEWLDDGIMTNQSMEWIECQSTHLTAFSVLLDPSLGIIVPEKHKHALSIISYIGSICSIIGLFLTILTYSMFRCLNRDRSGKILLNLCVSLLLMNLAFLLVAIEEYMDSSLLVIVDICTGVAMLTHYLVLTSLMWMLVEAIDMYHLLITVFATSETKFMCKRMICAWGIPLLIVVGTVLYDVQFYRSAESEYCLVTTSKPVLYYVTYLGPSCLILAINCIVFVLVSRVLFQRGHGRPVGKVGFSSEGPIITVAQIRGAFTVMTLLGVTWVFGALALGEAKLLFQYVFCISNSLQGFIIFIVRCVQYPEARMAWVTFLHTGKLKKHRGPRGALGLPSSSAGNSHSRHTITSSTHSQTHSQSQSQSQSQSKLQGVAHLRSHDKNQVHSKLHPSSSTSTRKTSLPESSSSLSNNGGSLWSHFRQRECRNKQCSNVYSSWNFRSIFGGSAQVSGHKTKPDSVSQKELEKDENLHHRVASDGEYCNSTTISATLTRELKQTLEERSSDYPLSRTQSMHIRPVCCSPVLCRKSSEVVDGTGDMKRGGSMKLWTFQPSQHHKEKQCCNNSQQSLSTKEGEDTSWQFMRAPPDGMSESKSTAVAESHTTSHSHSDQGYMSGACTAEHSPESPRQEPKQILSNTSPIQPDVCCQDQRLTVSTPDQLYPSPNEKIAEEHNKAMLTRSDSDITITLPKPEKLLQDNREIDSNGPDTYVVIRGETIYTNNTSVHPKLVQVNNSSMSIQHSAAGGGGHYFEGAGTELREVHYLDRPPQPRPGNDSRRSSSTKSFSSSEGNNGGSSSSGSLQSENYSLEMEPRVIQLSARRRPVHHRRHTKRIRCEEVL